MKTLANLHSQFPKQELSATQSDKELRHRAFAPIIQSLSGKKAIYHERNTYIITVEDILITPERFEATARPILHIPSGNLLDKFAKNESWKFGSAWAHLRLIENRFASYSSWRLWPEEDFVKKIESLAMQNEFDRALDLL